MPRPVHPLSPLQIPMSPTTLSSTSIDSPFSTYSWDNPPYVSPSAAPGVGVLDMFRLPPTPKRRRFTLRWRSNKVVPGGAYDSNDSDASYADSGDSRIRWRSVTPPPSPRSLDIAEQEAWKARNCREQWVCRLLSGGCLCAIITLLHL